MFLISLIYQWIRKSIRTLAAICSATVLLTAPGILPAQPSLSAPGQPTIEFLDEIPPPVVVTDPDKGSDTSKILDPRERLLASPDRIGFGSAATGGTHYVYVKNFAELQSAIETDGNYVILDPSLSNRELPFSDMIFPGNNITLDGSQAPGLVMFPDYSSGFPRNKPMINNIGVGGVGNKIFHSFKLEGRRQFPYDPNSRSGNVGGLFIREGTNYWVDHVEVTDFWDDAFISGIGNSNSGDYITLSNIKVHNTDKGYQAFNMESPQEGRGHITIFNSEWAAKGRNPENRGAENFHFFNNWVHSWRWGATSSGGRGQVSAGHSSGSRSTDANMLSENNVYSSPSATNNCAEVADPTVNYGGWLYTNGNSIYNNHDQCGSPNHVGPNENRGPGKPNIPYSYTLKPTDEVVSYVQSNAGALK
ncbi:hypothetical protein AB833_25940 [Chromatiales bacterium (ex Bugula neritina AB1)]|nr:hypothetical protein AB833_25940 [Chromatiales bacterium (ex Bugula neritina AB1)]